MTPEIAGYISSIRKRYCASGTFAANTLTLMVGTAIAQAIPILVSPILTRLYSPKDFGLFALFTSIVSILAVVSTGRYETTVMLPAQDKDAMSIVVLTLLITIAAVLIYLLAILLFNEPLMAMINNPEFSPWLYYIPLFVLMIAAYQPLNYWLNRKKLYRLMSSRSIIQTVSSSLVQLSLGFVSLTRIGLFAGAFTGYSVSLGLVGWQVWKDEKKNISEVKFGNMKAKAKEYKDFPLYAAPTSLLDTASSQAPILFITYTFGALQVGLFSLTMRVLALPAAFIGTAIGQVYHQRIAEMRHEKPEELTRFVLQSAKYLALLIAMPVLILGLSGPFLFAFIFGEKWYDAGVFSQIIVISIGLRFVVSPLSTIMSVTNNVKVVSKWKVLCFFTTCFSLYIGSFFSLTTFLIIFTIHDFILYSFLFYLIIEASRMEKGAV